MLSHDFKEFQHLTCDCNCHDAWAIVSNAMKIKKIENENANFQFYFIKINFYLSSINKNYFHVPKYVIKCKYDKQKKDFSKLTKINLSSIYKYIYI